MGASAEGRVVYVVYDDRRIVTTAVTLGPVVDDGQVVETGLATGDRIVLSGLSGLRDGMEVAVASEQGSGD